MSEGNSVKFKDRVLEFRNFAVRIFVDLPGYFRTRDCKNPRNENGTKPASAISCHTPFSADYLKTIVTIRVKKM
jgi:hypothetical protein